MTSPWTESARRTIDIELQACQALRQRLGEATGRAAFEHSCQLVRACRGRVVVTGMGKSGHIGGKIAATLASTGTAAFFVHPGEANHGDLGMIQPEDLVIGISYSGESAELLTLIPFLRRHDIRLIAMTGAANSRLARYADAVLDISVPREACPLGLAPTASTTATLVMGDALAVALLENRGFTREDFALSHPGGALGRRLLLRVADLMHSRELPLVSPEASLGEALLAMSRGGHGIALAVDSTQHLHGIFTDGDLRRSFSGTPLTLDSPLAPLLQRQPVHAAPDDLAADALKLMEQRRIGALPVLDEQGHIVGTLGFHTLLQAGL